MNIFILIPFTIHLLSVIKITLSTNIYIDNKEIFSKYSNNTNLLFLPNNLKAYFRNKNLSPTVSYISEIDIFKYKNGPNLNSDILIFKPNNTISLFPIDDETSASKPIVFLKMNIFPKNEKMEVYSKICKVYKYENMTSWVFDDTSKIIDMNEDYKNVLFYINDWGVYAIGCNSSLLPVIVSILYIVSIVI